MDNLPSDVKSLISRTKRHDGPTARDQARVTHKLNLALAAAGGAVGLAAAKTATAATVAVSSEVAAMTTATSAATTAVTATSSAGVTGASAVAGVVAGTMGKALVAPVAVATKWGSGSVAAWIFGASVVGAGAVSAPRVVDWVNTARLPEPTLVVQPRNDDQPSSLVSPPKVASPRTIETPQAAANEKAVQQNTPTPVQLAHPALEGTHSTSKGVETAPRPDVAIEKSADSSAMSANRAQTSSVNDPVSEVQLLSQAQRALADGDATVSLSLLHAHAQRFPKSALGAERAAARVFAYCQLGRVVEARAAAGVFFRSGSSSPLAPKVQASCINSSASEDRSTNFEKAGN